MQTSHFPSRFGIVILKPLFVPLFLVLAFAGPGLAQNKVDTNARTEITAGQSTYDSKNNQVRFEGGVVLAQPDFQLKCEELVANMVAEARESSLPQASGIRDAHANGDVFIQRFMPDGSTKIAISQQANYDTSTGLIMLTGYPKIKDGQQVIEGTTEGTRIFLTQNGEHRVEGPSRILFLPQGTTPDAFKLPDQKSLLNLGEEKDKDR